MERERERERERGRERGREGGREGGRGREGEDAKKVTECKRITERLCEMWMIENGGRERGETVCTFFLRKWFLQKSKNERVVNDKVTKVSIIL